MMGHRGKKKGGAEWDAFTGWSRFINWPAGERKRIKRRYNKRQRKKAKMELAQRVDDSALWKEWCNCRGWCDCQEQLDQESFAAYPMFPMDYALCMQQVEQANE